MSYYKIKYDCGCEYEGHNLSNNCPGGHYSKIISSEIKPELTEINRGQMETQVRRNFGKPTRANTTGKATAADTVYTKEETAKWIINYYKPTGSVLDASAGKDVFYNNFASKQRYRCEITDGIDFFKWNKKVDWIITNPPYSIYDYFLQHCFDVADNVVLFVPIAKAFKSNKVQKMVKQYGGLKEIVYMGNGSRHGFAFGFPVGCLYYKRGYVGDCRITDVAT